MKDVIFCMLGEKYSKILDTVPLSNDTVSRLITDMADNCETVLIDRMKTSPVGFTVQLDESTDNAGLAVLVIFVRYISEQSAHEDMLLCQAIKTTKEVRTYLKSWTLSLQKIILGGTFAQLSALLVQRQ